MTNNINLGIFFVTIAGYEPSKSLKCSIDVRNFFWQVLSSPTIWYYMFKVLLKNIETGAETGAEIMIVFY